MSALQQVLMSGYGVAAAAFSPSSLFAAGEQGFWYEPDDFSTMFQDSAGTVAVTATGQSVGKILDKSGRGWHCTQATAGSRPVLQQDAGGKYYLAFNGTNSWMVTASIDFSATDKLSIFIGNTKNSAAAKCLMELSTDTNSNFGSFYIFPGTNIGGDTWSSVATGNVNGNGGQGAYTAVSASNPDKAVISISHSIPAALSTIRKNTVAGTNGTASKGTGNFGNYPVYLGSRGGVSDFFGGNVYTTILRGAASTATEVTNTETYINGKTGAY